MSEHALILDCDGVLADIEKDGHLVAFNQVFDEAGFRVLARPEPTPAPAATR